MRIGQPPLGTPLNSSHSLSKGLVLCYMFNEGGGTIANNLTPNKGQNNGTLTNGATYTKSGGVMFNAASSNYINVSNNPAVAFGTGDFAFETLIYPTGATTNQYILIGKDDNVLGRQFALVINLDHTLTIVANKVCWVFFNTNTIYFTRATTSAAITTNAWYHIVVTRAAGVSNMYINGVSVATSTGGAGGGTDAMAMQSATALLQIGARTYTGFNNNFTGSMRYMRVYNRSLSATDVRQLYTNPYQMFEDGRKALAIEFINKYKFNNRGIRPRPFAPGHAK